MDQDPPGDPRLDELPSSDARLRATLHLALLAGIVGCACNVLRLMLDTASSTMLAAVIAWPLAMGAATWSVRRRPERIHHLSAGICIALVLVFGLMMRAAVQAAPEDAAPAMATTLQWAMVPTVIAFLLCPLRAAALLAAGSLTLDVAVLAVGTQSVAGLRHDAMLQLSVASCLAMAYTFVLMVGLGRIRRHAEQHGAALPTLRRRADFDALTGVLTRRAFIATLDSMKTHARPGANVAQALIVIDLDHFKRVNDTHGHAVGDQALQAFGALLRSIDGPGRVCGRWGGEEFAVLLEQVGDGGAEAVAESIRMQMHDARWPAGIALTASFGITHLRAGEADKTALERADAALYAAKRAGRDRCCVAVAARSPGEAVQVHAVRRSAGASPQAAGAQTMPARAEPVAARPVQAAGADPDRMAAGPAGPMLRDRTDAAARAQRHRGPGVAAEADPRTAIVDDRVRAARIVLTCALVLFGLAAAVTSWLDADPRMQPLHGAAIAALALLALAAVAKRVQPRTIAEGGAAIATLWLLAQLVVHAPLLHGEQRVLLLAQVSVWGQLVYISAALACRRFVAGLIGMLMLVVLCSVATGLATTSGAREAAWIVTVVANSLGAASVIVGTTLISRMIQRRYAAVAAMTLRAYDDSLSDPLTGLPNRRALDGALEAIGQPSGGSVAIIDLDHFKRINDTHGHVVGDAVLIGFAGLLRDTALPGETAGRWGGEEFVVAMHGDVDALAGRLERLRAAVAARGWPRGLRVTVSAGVAAVGQAGGARAAIDAADAALYVAKNEGRDRIGRADGSGCRDGRARCGGGQGGDRGGDRGSDAGGERGGAPDRPAAPFMPQSAVDG